MKPTEIIAEIVPPKLRNILKKIAENSCIDTIEDEHEKEIVQAYAILEVEELIKEYNSRRQKLNFSDIRKIIRDAEMSIWNHIEVLDGIRYEVSMTY